MLSAAAAATDYYVRYLRSPMDGSHRPMAHVKLLILVLVKPPWRSWLWGGIVTFEEIDFIIISIMAIIIILSRRGSETYYARV